MKYKPSNYNYCVCNRKGDYLLYNTLQGTKSFCKVKKCNEEVLRYLNTAEEVYNENQITNKLISKGFLIPQNYNEENELEKIFLDKVNDNKLNMIIAPTGKCNLRCTYCCEDFRSGSMSKSVQESIIKFVEKNIGKYNGVNIDWFGGEPLLAMDVIENLSTNIIRICNENKKIYTSFITTNGTLLDLSSFKKLYKLNVIMYQITIDGVKSVHDSQRIGINNQPTFNQIVSNLETIRDSKVGKHAIIMILTNYSKTLKNSIDQYKEYFSKKFNNDRRFCFTCNVIMDLGGERISNYKPNLLDYIGMNTFYNKIIENDNVKLKYIYEEFLEPGSQLCYAAKKNSFIISEDGKIYKCEHQYQTQKDNYTGVFDEMGNMVLNNKEKKWLGKFNFCQSELCKLKPLCLGEDCIEKRIEYNNKNIFGSTCGFRECHFMKKSIESVLKLLDHERNIFPEF